MIAASYGGWRPGLRRSFSGTTLALAIGMHRLLTLVTPTVVVLGLCSPGCVVGTPIVLDLAAVDLSGSAIAHLVGSLNDRSIRVLGIEGEPGTMGTER